MCCLSDEYIIHISHTHTVFAFHTVRQTSPPESGANRENHRAFLQGTFRMFKLDIVVCVLLSNNVTHSQVVC